MKPTENNNEAPLKPQRVAILTISDTRTEETDTSGKTLAELIGEAGHEVLCKKIVKDDKYDIRSLVATWVAEDQIDAVITTGGTGLTYRDITCEALEPLFDKTIEGFGELFRSLSYEEIGTSTIQSRAVAGISKNTYIFCLPGSTGACRTGWTKIISKQLDSRFGPCNLVNLKPRLCPN